MGNTVDRFGPVQKNWDQFKQHWMEGERRGNSVEWISTRYPNTKVIQYNVRIQHEQNYQRLLGIRSRSLYLVNAREIPTNVGNCGSDADYKKIFIQGIPKRINEIQKIPYPQIFHVYDTTLQGYSELTPIVGYFQIQPNQICINQLGQVKVWLNQNLEQFRPIGKQVSQTYMLYNLLDVLAGITDQQSQARYPNINDYLRNSGIQRFSDARVFFKQYLLQYNNGQVPTLLSPQSLGSLQDSHYLARMSQSRRFNPLITSQRQIQIQNNTYNPPIFNVVESKNIQNNTNIVQTQVSHKPRQQESIVIRQTVPYQPVYQFSPQQQIFVRQKTVYQQQPVVIQRKVEQIPHITLGLRERPVQNTYQQNRIIVTQPIQVKTSRYVQQTPARDLYRQSRAQGRSTHQLYQSNIYNQYKPSYIQQNQVLNRSTVAHNINLEPSRQISYQNVQNRSLSSSVSHNQYQPIIQQKNIQHSLSQPIQTQSIMTYQPVMNRSQVNVPLPQPAKTQFRHSQVYVSPTVQPTQILNNNILIRPNQQTQLYQSKRSYQGGIQNQMFRSSQAQQQNYINKPYLSQSVLLPQNMPKNPENRVLIVQNKSISASPQNYQPKIQIKIQATSVKQQAINVKTQIQHQNVVKYPPQQLIIQNLPQQPILQNLPPQPVVQHQYLPSQVQNQSPVILSPQAQIQYKSPSQFQPISQPQHLQEAQINQRMQISPTQYQQNIQQINIPKSQITKNPSISININGQSNINQQISSPTKIQPTVYPSLQRVQSSKKIVQNNYSQQKQISNFSNKQQNNNEIFKISDINIKKLSPEKPGLDSVTFRMSQSNINLPNSGINSLQITESFDYNTRKDYFSQYSNLNSEGKLQNQRILNQQINYNEANLDAFKKQKWNNLSYQSIKEQPIHQSSFNNQQFKYSSKKNNLFDVDDGKSSPQFLALLTQIKTQDVSSSFLKNQKYGKQSSTFDKYKNINNFATTSNYSIDFNVSQIKSSGLTANKYQNYQYEMTQNLQNKAKEVSNVNANYTKQLFNKYAYGNQGVKKQYNYDFSNDYTSQDFKQLMKKNLDLSEYDKLASKSSAQYIYTSNFASKQTYVETKQQQFSVKSKNKAYESYIDPDLQADLTKISTQNL